MYHVRIIYIYIYIIRFDIRIISTLHTAIFIMKHTMSSQLCFLPFLSTCYFTSLNSAIKMVRTTS